MEGQKVFELARNIGMTNKRLMAELKSIGIEPKSYMSVLDDRTVNLIMVKFAKARSLKAEEKPQDKKRGAVLIKKKHKETEPAVKEIEATTKELEPKIDVTKPKEMLIPAEPGLTAAKDVVEPPVSKAVEASMIGVIEVKREDKKASEKPVKFPEKIEPEKKESVFKPKDKTKKFKNLKTLEKESKHTNDLIRWDELQVFQKRPVKQKPASKKIKKLSAPEEITKPRRKVIKIHEGITIKEFAEAIGQKSGEIIKRLMEMGMMATINQPMDMDAAILIADGLGLKIETVSAVSTEDIITELQDDASTLAPRSPVVTIMGHVDHGKTSLLDAIRQTKVTEGEAGGITQHIGAYKVKVGGRNVVFLDTPGHEAFTAMRARGAQVTDIVVLVVAADDGVMPQTVEAINHAKAAKVPIIVAINKIDKPEANPERIKQALTEYELVPEAWGGETIYVEVSAKKKINLETLLEMILLQADVLELKANSDKPARGTIVEAKLDKGRGPVATVLIQSGTLKVGDAFVTGTFFGRVRALIDDMGIKVESAGPATPVEVIGLEGVPQAGDAFVVVEDEKVAKEIAVTRLHRQRSAELAKAKKITLDDLYAKIKEGEVKELNIIVKGDVQGSVEAIKEALERLSTSAVKLNVIHGSVGGITETDVMLASASNAIIIGFNIRPEAKASALSEKENVDIRLYTVIYDAIADVKSAMEGLLEPTLKERSLGRAEVRQTFSISNIGVIAGCHVIDGSIIRACAGVRVLRDNVVIYEGKLSSLKRFKEDAKEVQTGYECGIGIENFNDIKVGDVIEAYAIDKIAAKL
ncbi:MAG: translation initiation factor IF-2 [Nitrospirae bacterium]|nr:translation initiation factor IF-2 [Nitrospirota bacterium]